MPQNILIVWHIPSYGIGYFKNILSAFYTGRISLNQKEIVEGISQSELENGFLRTNGFVFDKVYYLYPSDETSGKISDRTKSDYITGRAKVELTNDDIIRDSKTLKIWEDVFEKKLKSIKDEADFVRISFPKKYDSFISQYWRNIHYYPISQQIEWFENFSNASIAYDKERIHFIDISKVYDVNDLRDEEVLTSVLINIFSDNGFVNSKDSFFINSGLGTLEMNLAFRNVVEDPKFNSLNISIFSIVDQKENTKINYRFRDLKYAFKKSPRPQKLTVLPNSSQKNKEYFEFAVYPNKIIPIKFCDISFITTCHADSSKNDRYLQKIDGSFFRVVKTNLDKFEKLLPKEHFCRINKATIISNYGGNIQGWAPNYEEVFLSGQYVDNNSLYRASKQSDKEYKKDLVGKPVTFSITPGYKDKFREWKKIV